MIMSLKIFDNLLAVYIDLLPNDFNDYWFRRNIVDTVCSTVIRKALFFFLLNY